MRLLSQRPRHRALRVVERDAAMKILAPDELRALEQRVFDGLGLPPVLVMDTAGRAVADAIVARLGGGLGRTAEVLCGVGNNGGDGLVVARVLADRGWQVRCWIAGDEDRWSAESLVHRRAAARHGRVAFGTVTEDLAPLHAALLAADLVVDALVGIGIRGELRGPVRALLDCAVATLSARRHAAVTVAVDLPSGLCAHSGLVLGAALPCDVVVTMAALKPGLLRGAGPSLWRHVVIADIGVPAAWWQDDARQVVLDAAWARQALPPRHDDVHKYRAGHALVVAGSPGMAGAALLASKACLQAGAGLTTLWTDPQLQMALQGRLPDLMVAVDGGELAAFAALVERCHAAAAGPGLGRSAACALRLAHLYAQPRLPLVLDADALAWLAGHHAEAPTRDVPAVLTPHTGEAARLLQCDVAAIAADPWHAAQQLAAQFAAVVVLKGPQTVIATADRRLAIHHRPNAALAKAGSGDVLAGIIVALLAQGLAPFEAAALGVFLHGEAGARLRQRSGRRAGLASQLPGELARVIASLEHPLVPAHADR